MRDVDGLGVDNVDWPPELHAFKTADTTHYVTATVAAAIACATCLVHFAAADRRSLTIEVWVPYPRPPLAEFRHRRFAAEVHHRSCHPPRLRLVAAAAAGATDDPGSGEPDMHYVLTTGAGPDGPVLPGLILTTSDPVVVRDHDLAEGRSAWISTYLELGFQLFVSAEISWIAAHAAVATAVEGTVDGALFSLSGTIGERPVPLLQWTRDVGHPAYRSWCRAVAASGALFVLYGEYIRVDTHSGAVELAPGGRLGDIAAAVVRVQVGPAPDRDDELSART